MSSYMLIKKRQIIFTVIEYDTISIGKTLKGDISRLFHFVQICILHNTSD